jgi:hypothetical protein
MPATITPEMTESYARDGVVLVKGLFSPEWVEVLRQGVEANMADPSAAADGDAEARRGGAVL